MPAPSTPTALSTASVPDGPRRRLAVTAQARRALARVRRASGPQAVLLSWPAGATYLPAAAFTPSDYDVIVGHVVCCPIYADVRQLAYYTGRPAVLDVPDTAVRPRPILRLKPASR